MCRRASSLLLTLALLVCSNAVAQRDSGSCPETEPPYQRIVTLSPHLTELAYAAGAGDHLVGTVEWSDYPEDALELPRVGDAFRIDMERLLELEPDLVIAWSSGNPGAALEQVRSFCIRVVETEPRELADVSRDLARMGELAGTNSSANAAAEEYDRRLDRLREQHRGEVAVRYFYQVADRPLFTVGGDHLISQALAVCGGENVFSDIGALAPQVSREAVIASAPDAMIAPTRHDSPDGDPLDPWRSWPSIPAVESDALFLLPADAISRATPRILDAIEIACNLFGTLRTRSQAE